MDNEDIEITLTKKELFRIQDLIESITGESDFEYQPNDYKNQMSELELKIFKAITGAK